MHVEKDLRSTSRKARFFARLGRMMGDFGAYCRRRRNGMGAGRAALANGREKMQSAI
jgi:hypothetical protein